MNEQNTPQKDAKEELLDEDYLMNIMSGDIEVKITKQVQSKEDENLVIQKQALQSKQLKRLKDLSYLSYYKRRCLIQLRQ